ncbi:hypothetical protein FQN54_002297 [Arachnomyces sp. PD_36]|nr:hypothetical protein FQN54_002297 [Arachnomyces sp. PD_36]
MVVYYQVAGKKVGSHVLSMGVLATLFGGSYLAMPSGPKKENGPPINASSKDEEKFIQCVILFFGDK